MNNSTIAPATNYQQMLQEAANSYVQRHQGEHLNDNAHLFQRAVEQMQRVFGASQAQAEKAVHLALQDRAEQDERVNAAFDGLASAETLVAAGVEFMQRMAAGTSASVICHTTAQYLAGLYSIPLQQAEDAAAIAFGRSNPSPLYMDISRSDSQMVMLRDNERQICYAIPVSMIVQGLIQNPARRRLHIVH